MKLTLAISFAFSTLGIITANAIAQSPTHSLHQDLSNPSDSRGIWRCNVVENPWLYIQPIQEVSCLHVFPELGLGNAEPYRAPIWNYPGIDYTDASNAEFLPKPIQITWLTPGENAPLWLDLMPNPNYSETATSGLKTKGSLQVSRFDTTAITWLMQQQSPEKKHPFTFELAATESISRNRDDRSMRLHFVDW